MKTNFRIPVQSSPVISDTLLYRVGPVVSGIHHYIPALIFLSSDRQAGEFDTVAG